MLSRVANSICWIARYMERTNGMLRLLRTNYISSQDEVSDFSWHSVLRLYSDLPTSQTEQIKNNSSKVLDHLLLDVNNTASVCNNIYRSRENARAAQDHITKEVWEQINGMYHLVNHPSVLNRLNNYQGPEVIELFQKQCVMYTGITEITMSRGMGWQFMNLGKFVER